MRRVWGLLVGVLALASCSPPATIDPVRLLGPPWELERLSIGGEDRPVSWGPLRPTLSFDDRGGYGVYLCNTSSGEYWVDGPLLRTRLQLSTLVGCPEGADDLANDVGRLFGSETVWSVKSGVLRIESGDARGRFVRRDPPAPTYGLSILARERADDEGQYRFGYERRESGAVALVVDGRDGRWREWESARLLAEEDGPEAQALAVGDGVFVMGHTPRSTVRVEYRLAGEEPVALDVERLPRDLMGFGGLVDDAGGIVVAFDAAGRELGRFGPVA